MTQVANRVAIYSVAPKARNRINTTEHAHHVSRVNPIPRLGRNTVDRNAIGDLRHLLIGAALVICLLRGPAEKAWVGWHGGIRIRRAE
jgi:hypothetical protein